MSMFKRARMVMSHVFIDINKVFKNIILQLDCLSMLAERFALHLGIVLISISHILAHGLYSILFRLHTGTQGVPHQIDENVSFFLLL